MTKLLLIVGYLLGLLALGLFVSAGLAYFDVISGSTLFYFLGGVGSGVLHFIFVSLGGQNIGGLR